MARKPELDRVARLEREIAVLRHLVSALAIKTMGSRWTTSVLDGLAAAQGLDRPTEEEPS